MTFPCPFPQAQFEASLYFFEKALEHDPSSLNSMNNIGKSYELMGRLQEAEQWFRKAAEESGGLYGDAFSNLGLLAMNKEQNYEVCLHLRSFTGWCFHRRPLRSFRGL